MTFNPVFAAAIVAALSTAAPLQAAEIPNGTVSISGLFNPEVDFSKINTFQAASGPTFQVSGAGGFADVGALFGTMNGTLDFAGLVGATQAEHLDDFFTFDDGHEGTYRFSVESVKTVAMSVADGISSSVSLYLLGTTWDPDLGYDPTATSLTLSFNRTGNSPWSTSATLAVPPAPLDAVPEPASWAMMVGGFGLMGATMRAGRRRMRGISFA